ncbi:MAG: hypothetical protein EB066_08615, partial [Betaproteobacteria bacterium]|nr:hypothetical protein [Betaproteobacteria bacterium]
ASQTSIYWDYGTGNTWYDIDNITFMNTFAAPITWNGNGGGLNFKDKIENQSSQTITFGSMNFSGGKSGATAIELNPVNGDMIFSGGNLYNDNSLGYKVYGGNSKMLTLGTTLGVGTNAAKVGLNIEQYSKVYITAAQSYQSNTAIKTGELWIGTGGSLNTSSRVDLGLTDTNTAKFYLTGGVTNSNNITVLSTNTGGVKVLGGLSASGTNVFAGNVTNNNSGGVWLENTVAGGTVALTGVLSGTGSVTAGGLGTVRLSGTNNTFSGNVTVNSGVLSGAQWLTNSSLGVSSFGNHDTNGSWLILNGGTVQYTGATNNSYFMKLNVSTNGGTVDSSGVGILNLAKGANGFTLAGNDTANRTFTLTGTNTASLGTRNNFNGSITNGAGGAVVTVVKSGTGTWELGYSGNTFSGGLEIRQGNMIFGGGTALQTNSVGLGDVKMFNDSGIGSSSTTIRTGSVSTTFKLGGTNVMAYVDLPKVVLTNNTIINNGTNVSTTGGIAYSNNAANFIATLGSVSGVSETGGSYSLTKIGGGVLTLNGSNSYSGGTIMSNGILYVTNTGTLGSASSAVTLAGGILDLGNATRTNGTITVS